MNALRELAEAVREMKILEGQTGLESTIPLEHAEVRVMKVVDRILSEPSPEVDWEAIGKAGYEFDCTLMINPDEWEDLDEGTKENYCNAAKAVIAAYENQKGNGAS